MREFLIKEKEQIRYAAFVAIGLSLLCLVIHLLFLILPIHKYNWSIYPRDFSQWYGIITGQFIHAGWGHLLTNIPPLLFTTLILFYFYRSIGWSCFVLILSLTGTMVFFFGRNYSHIGASGLVYGLISFIFFSGVFRRDIKSMALMGIMVIMYSGYLAGFFPVEERVSWESHLFGAIAGLWTSFVFRSYREKDDPMQKKDHEPLDIEKEYFLDRDVFEKTMEQRRIEAEEAEIEARQSSNEDSTYYY